MLAKCAAFVLMLMTCQISSAQDAAISILSEPLKSPSGDTCPWPAIVMVDGLDADAQTDIIKSMGRLERMMKKSPYASIAIKPMVKVDAKAGVFRQYNYYFVAYGTLDKLTDEDLLTDILVGDEKPADAVTKDLGSDGDDKFDYSEQTLLKRIKLHTITKSTEKKTEASLHAGAVVLPSHPNSSEKSQWSAIETPEEKMPYSGMGVFTKVTPLLGVQDGLFFETHLVFYEPEGWFRGRNLLGAKLAPLITNQVRELRRSLAK